MKTVRKYFSILVLICVIFSHTSVEGARAQDVEIKAQRDGNIKEVSFPTPAFGPTSGGTLRWQQEIEQIGASYIRLRISNVKTQNAEGVVLSLRDRNGRLVRKYTGAELLKKSSLWTDVVPGSYVLISLNSTKAPEGFGLLIDRIAYQATAGAPLSTVGKDEKQHIAEYANDVTISKLQRPIARLSFIQDDDLGTCTGFLIKPGQLMTNHHCVNTQEVCDTTRAIFGYQKDKNDNLQLGEQYECRRVIEDKTNFELDFAILEIANNPEEVWGIIPIGIGTDPKTGDEMFIIQHPAGEPKQISKKNCKVEKVPVNGRATKTDFSHTCDTVGGSSGSPVFDKFGTLVGLHHYGFKEGGAWTKNRAIRMKKIIEKLGE